MVRAVMRRLIALLLSTTLSLAAAEWAVSAARGHAYRFLNLFVPSEVYGVVLEPNASSRVRSPKGRITHIRTNSLGLRGEEWPSAPGGARVLVLGDSQVFGYNVAEHETFTARLSALAGVTVDNAGVPTWGPHEYVRALEEHGRKTRPTHAVIVANAANDWFESPVPNVRRTRALDGFATYRDLSAPAPRQFWGRQWLLGRSQLSFAVRELWTTHSPSFVPPPHAADALLEQSSALHGRLSEHLERANAVCADCGCTLVVVALPLDVQVHASEWNKYRHPARDMSATLALGAELVSETRALGLQGVDLLPALREASPGVFLDDDYHLSARGHEVVARALLPFVRTGS